MTAIAATSRTVPEGYVQVSYDLFSLTEHALTKVYDWTDSRQPSLLCETGASTIELLGHLDKSDSHGGLVRQIDYLEWARRLQQQFPDFCLDERLPQSDRLSLLRAALSSEAERCEMLLKPVRQIQLCKSVAESVFDILHSGRIEPRSLHDAPRLGPDWLNHATSVACYSILLATLLGTRNEDSLRRIALGAMLHDLGLRRGGEEKRSKDEARRHFESHPQRAYEHLMGDPHVSREQLLMVYQHHEALNGCGFPVGILADEIHPWAQLLRVTDTFDELTHSAATSKRMPAAEALSVMRSESGETLNKEMVQCWTQVMSPK